MTSIKSVIVAGLMVAMIVPPTHCYPQWPQVENELFQTEPPAVGNEWFQTESPAMEDQWAEFKGIIIAEKLKVTCIMKEA